MYLTVVCKLSRCTIHRKTLERKRKYSDFQTVCRLENLLCRGNCQIFLSKLLKFHFLNCQKKGWFLHIFQNLVIFVIYLFIYLFHKFYISTLRNLIPAPLGSLMSAVMLQNREFELNKSILNH
jgi:hypothetical protein